MIESVEFAKLSGSGNDFICIDNRSGRYNDILSDPRRSGQFAKSLCQRGLGVGADGVIFAVEPEIEGVAHVGARFFEADGSEAELCGNGTGCFVQWVIASGWFAGEGEEVKILTTAGIVLGRKSDGNYIRVCIPLPTDMTRDIEFALGERAMKCDFAITGVPHAIIYVDDVEKTDVAHLGPAIRHHARFGPRGVNANFVQVIREGEISVRTWEFGVEGETLACGTGSAAAAIMTGLRMNWPQQYIKGQEPVMVHAHSGDILRVYFTRQDDGSITDVCLETYVRFINTGLLHSDMVRRATSLPTQPNVK